jgi:hypothetical protein
MDLLDGHATHAHPVGCAAQKFVSATFAMFGVARRRGGRGFCTSAVRAIDLPRECRCVGDVVERIPRDRKEPSGVVYLEPGGIFFGGANGTDAKNMQPCAAGAFLRVGVGGEE